MTIQYEYSANMKYIYDHLSDEKSREIFWARLKLDMDKSYSNYLAMLSAADYCVRDASLTIQETWDFISDIPQKRKKLFLYGAAGVGKSIMKCLSESNKHFDGFCDTYKHGQKIGGYDVISPEALIKDKRNCYVIITAILGYKSILNYLKSNGFSDDQILYPFGRLPEPDEKPHQYFEFMQYFHEGAFIDAGCFDFGTSFEFYNIVKSMGLSQHSPIIALEPDPDNFVNCEKVFLASDIPNAKVLNYALNSTETDLDFMSGNGSDSFVPDDHSLTSIEHSNGGCIKKVHAVKLDDIVNEKVGMIKMDIEGAELDALIGAEKIIKRDKPLLAICVYHKIGDVLAITDHIHSLVPEYKFKLRHYGLLDLETVLYAYIE